MENTGITLGSTKRVLEVVEGVIFNDNNTDSFNIGKYIEVSNCYSLSSIKKRDEVILKCLNNEEYSIENEKKKDGSQLLKYSGSKNKFKEIFKNVFPRVSEGVDTIVDCFFGTGGSTTVCKEEIEKSNIKNVIGIEKNLTLLQLHDDVKNKPYELIGQIHSILKEVYSKYGTLSLEVSQLKEVKSDLERKIIKQEQMKNLNVYTSSLFFILNCMSFNGIYKYDFKNNISKEFSVSSDMKKFIGGVLRFPQKILDRSDFYNSYNFHFIYDDGVEFINKYKSDNVLFLIDPPYLEMNGNKWKGGDFNYGLEGTKKDKEEMLDFNHKQLVETMRGSNYIYNNNRNGVLNNYVEDCKSEGEIINKISIFKKKSTKKTDENKHISYLVEYVLYRNTNNVEYKPQLVKCS